MAIALETIVKQLEGSGIIAPGKLENFIPPKASPKNAEELIRELFKQNHLTKFQAQQVALGKAQALILGGYTILDRIGAGGMGQVFKAEHRRMKRVVAIKMLPPSLMKDPAAAARFQREVEAAAKLLHPNIVSAFDADEANGVHFLVMEYVEGSDLSALVKKHGPLPLSKALNYLLQAARGLEYAHKKGVVHRDIKPGNLLVDSEGTVKILDMGLARIDAGGDQATQAELTGTGAVMGTVDYMAPEQALSTKGVDARADIYSLGCTLYYLLAGKCTYDGDTLMAKLLAHREAPIPSLADVQEGVPEAVQAIFAKMVAKRVEDRYPSMTAVIADLEKAIAGQSAPANLAPPASTSDTGLTKFFQEMPSPGTKKGKSTGVAGVAAAATPAEARRGQAAPDHSHPNAKKLNPKLVLYGSLAGGGLALLGIPLVLYFALSGGNKPTPPPPVSPLPVAGEGPGARGPAASADYALDFAAGNQVTIPTLKLPLTGPITLEGYVTLSAQAQLAATIPAQLVGVNKQLEINVPLAGYPRVYAYPSGAEKLLAPANKSPLAAGRRTHVAAVWNDGQLKLFVDGAKVANKVTSPGLSLSSPEANFTMGGGTWAGLIDEVRISKSDRYSAGFEPPQHFTSDADTLALWHFDEGSGDTLRDASPNGHDGKITDAKWVNADGSAITMPPQAASHALDFDGQQSYVATPIFYDASHPITVEAYVTPRTIKGTGDIVSDADSAGIRLGRTGGFWNWNVNFPSTLNSASGVIPHKRVHLAGVWDGKEARIYLDGQLEQATPEPLLKRSKLPLVMGANPNSTDSAAPYFKDTKWHFDGQIDEVRISKTARYAAAFTPKPRFEPDADTLALYHFDEGSGEIANDASPNKNYAHIFGAKWTPVATSGATAGSSSSTGATDPDRRAALWALALGGTVRIGATEIATPDQLPATRFRLSSLQLGKTRFRDDELIDHFAGLDVVRLYLDVSSCSDTTLAKLADLAKRRPGGFSKLNTVNLVNTEITDDGLKHLAAFPSIRTIYLQNNGQLTNGCLKSLESLAKLTHVDLRTTKVTAAGIAALKKALPNCQIDWSDPAQPATPQAAASPRLVEVAELASASPGFPFVAGDGRTIYWEAASGMTPVLMFARRSALTEPFVLGGQLISGNWRHPAVSDDGLQLVMVRVLNGNSRLYTATRGSVQKSFGQPRELTELRIADAREEEGPWLSPDGLTLWYQAAVEGGTRLYSAIRKSVADPWAPPQPLPIELGALRPVLTWPMSADGGKVLVCAYESSLGQERIAIWRRASLKDPFRDGKFVSVEGKELVGYNCPRYVASTNELYVSQRNAQRLWVVKNFRLTPDVPATDPDRRAAAWGLERGVYVVVREPGGQPQQINAGSPLPAGPFRVEKIEMTNKQRPDSELACLAGLPELGDLRLGNNGITSAGLHNIGPLPKLVHLEVFGSTVDDEGAAYIADTWPQLTFLNLNGSAVMTESLRHLGRLKQLETLKLRKAPITSAGLAHLEGLSKLTLLELTETSVTDEGLVSLAKIRSLRNLELSKTQVTKAGAASLKKAMPDCNVYWEDPAKPTK